MGYKYGHTPFNSLQEMATNGVLPKRLADCPFHVCSAYIYGNSNKYPLKKKTAGSINKYKPVESVGDCVSVNLLVSSTPGIIAHISVFIMRK